MAREERVRFCDACNAVISWYAEHCESCGAQVAASGETPAEPGEVRLFQAQMRLIHRTRENAEELGRDLRALSRRVEELEGEPRSASSIERLRAASGRLLELEETWSEIQREYNRSSEMIEEEFHEQVSSGQIDAEMPGEKAAALEKSMSGLFRRLEDLEGDMQRLGRLLDHLTARSRSGLMGLSTDGRGTMRVGALATLLALAGATYGVLVAAVPPLDLCAIVLPSWLGLVLLFLNARAKSL